MDSLTILVVALVCTVVLLLIVFFALRGRGDDRALGDVTGQLRILVQEQSRLQSTVSDGLQKQERALSEVVQKSLNRTQQTVAESLTQQSESTKDSLIKLHERLVEITKAEESIKNLTTSVNDLNTVFIDPHKRGSLGEQQLDAIVKNVLPPTLYAFQETIRKEDSSVRVDCLIKLPNPPGPIGVDSKFPYEHYQKMQESNSKAEEEQARTQFSKSVQVQMRDISSKYIVSGTTADLALMFVPSEAVYATIYSRCPEVMEDMQRLKVYIVSPTTLMATLTTVRAVVGTVELQKRVGEVIDELRKKVAQNAENLHSRAETLEKTFKKLERDVHDVVVSSRKVSNEIGALVDPTKLSDES